MKRTILFFLLMATGLALAAYFAHTTCTFLKGAGDERLLRRSAAAARQTKETRAKRAAAWAGLRKDIERRLRAFDGTAGIVVKDLDMDWEINSNKDTPIPSASIVKIPVMMAYYLAAREGKADLRAKIPVTDAQKTAGSGLLKNAVAGQAFSIEDIIILMITHSDNTASNILIDRMGFDALNGYFLKMGLKHTNLSRRMMDFKARGNRVENYTTAADMAYLLERLYRGRFLNAAASKKCLEILAGSQVNDRIPKLLPKDTVVAHKTGLENGLCHDVGIVYAPKGNYLICVLTKHRHKTARETKKLISEISLRIYDYYNEF